MYSNFGHYTSHFELTMKFNITKIINWVMLLLAMLLSILYDLKWLWFMLLLVFVFLIFIKIEDQLDNKATKKQNVYAERQLNLINKLDAHDSFDSLTKLDASRVTEESKIDVEVSKKQFSYDNYHDGHTEEIWKGIDFRVRTEFSNLDKKYYSFKEVEPKAETKLKYPFLSKNQRKVKILGDAILARTKSKKLTKNILVSQYGFKEETAKYAVGYDGYYDW